MLTLCLTMLVCADIQPLYGPIDRDLFRQVVAKEKVDGKVGIPGVHYLPHVPVNETFKSTIILRSDNNDHDIQMTAGFVDENGDEASVDYTIAGQSFTGSSGFTGTLRELSTMRISVKSASSRSLQFVMIAQLNNLSDTFTDDIDMEVTISRYNGGDKTAIVSLGAPKPTLALRFSFHTIRDDITGEENLRGFALMNSSLDECSCFGAIADEQGNSQGFEFQLGPWGKWVGLLQDLAPEMNMNTETTGLVIILCDEEIASMGLQFEGSNMGGVTIKREI